MPCFVNFFLVLAGQKWLKSVKIWQSCSQMYTATFYEPRRKCTFTFFQVRCAHKSGDVINFITVACRIYSRLKWYKNCENRLRLAKVIVKNKMSRFFMVQCVYSLIKLVEFLSLCYRFLCFRWIKIIIIQNIKQQGRSQRGAWVHVLPSYRRSIFVTAPLAFSMVSIHSFVCPSVRPSIHPFIHSFTHSCRPG